MPTVVAVSIAYLTAVAAHFLLNRSWVFSDQPGELPSQAWRYALTVVTCWLSTVLIVALALQWWTSQVLLAKMLAIPPVALLGFLLMKGFVFRRSMN